MKIVAKEDFIIRIDATVNAYISKGNEFEVYPTSDGMKFLFMGKEYSPYDFMGLFRTVG